MVMVDNDTKYRPLSHRRRRRCGPSEKKKIARGSPDTRNLPIRRRATMFPDSGENMEYGAFMTSRWRRLAPKA
jgi:hypothetical protein